MSDATKLYILIGMGLAANGLLNTKPIPNEKFPAKIGLCVGVFVVILLWPLPLMWHLWRLVSGTTKT